MRVDKIAEYRKLKCWLQKVTKGEPLSPSSLHIMLLLLSPVRTTISCPEDMSSNNENQSRAGRELKSVPFSRRSRDTKAL
jgi:hypothetical protein